MGAHQTSARRKPARRQGAPGARFVVAEHRKRRVRRPHFYQHSQPVRVLLHIWHALGQPSTWLMLALVLFLLSK